jgi:Protein of unknwon function (DUF3310)
MSDPVHHPAHYGGHPSGVECLTVVRPMSFCLGNAVKYVWRAGLKGDLREDLLKARFYLVDAGRGLDAGCEPAFIAAHRVAATSDFIALTGVGWNRFLAGFDGLWQGSVIEWCWYAHHRRPSGLCLREAIGYLDRWIGVKE